MPIPTLPAQDWSCIEFLSDLHLHEGPAGASTAHAFTHYLQHTPANAVFLLGDIFEVWIGDDAATPGSFEARIAEQIHALSQRTAVFFMAGNRDFLLGSAYLAQAGMQALHDPTCLDLGAKERWLLTHGDAWCLDDVDYQRFRQQVRTPAWQATLLAKPLAERQAIARAMRQASASKQAEMASHADVDAATAQAAMQTCGARVLLHGHTHRPAVHAMPAPASSGSSPDDGGPPATRIVLSDWDLHAHPSRADVIRLTRQAEASTSWTWQRIGLTQPDPQATALFGTSPFLG